MSGRPLVAWVVVLRTDPSEPAWWWSGEDNLFWRTTSRHAKRFKSREEADAFMIEQTLQGENEFLDPAVRISTEAVKIEDVLGGRVG